MYHKKGIGNIYKEIAKGIKDRGAEVIFNCEISDMRKIHHAAARVHTEITNLGYQKLILASNAATAPSLA